jgi:hypothetical protein
MPPSPIWIYHITHIGNLPDIIQRGGLFANSALSQIHANYHDLAHQSIQARRAKIMIDCGPHGRLHDYVPFYFAPLSPMLYAHFKGNVVGNKDGQDPIIYLVSSVETVQAAHKAFVFTDGHATME